ncbi:hypothetical protein SEA_ATUIN_101 [Arthrobacter phage Atuin]|nr:hypothetical protein SEA_ATUIN_200 [Arthrobacter phage Atuin]
MNLSDDHNNLREVLANIGYDGSHVDDEQIIEAIVEISITLDRLKLSAEARQIVMDLVSREGEDAIHNVMNFGEDAWMKDFDYGNDGVGSYVRVKPDAYDTPSGSRHNGLVGVLTSLRGHRADVRYIGRAAGSAMKHSKEALQSLRHGVK